MSFHPLHAQQVLRRVTSDFALTGVADEDDGMVEIDAKDLILVEGDDSDASSDANEKVTEENDMFHDMFSGGAQETGAETFYKESSADILKKQVQEPTFICSSE